MAKTKVTVPVVKGARFTIRKGLTPRRESEATAELSALVAQGFKVCAISKTHEGVCLEMAKTEEWSLAELLDEVRELLGA